MKFNEDAIADRKFRVERTRENRRMHKLMLMRERFQNLSYSAQEATESFKQLRKALTT